MDKSTRHALLYKAAMTADGALAGDFSVLNGASRAMGRQTGRQRGRGVEIVSLMFEHFGDFAQAAEATRRFRQHYRIDYTTLIAGISDKDEAAKKLPTLNRVYAFPTTLFIDRKGSVRKIHTDFSGPATGYHYTRFSDDVKATLDQLLAET